MRVGVREGRAEDKTRGNWDGDGPRPLTWAAWYPAADDSVEQAQLMGAADAPWFMLGSAARGAPLAARARSYPVVLLSHGTGRSSPWAWNGWAGGWPSVDLSPWR